MYVITSSTNYVASSEAEILREAGYCEYPIGTAFFEAFGANYMRSNSLQWLRLYCTMVRMPTKRGHNSCMNSVLPSQINEVLTTFGIIYNRQNLPFGLCEAAGKISMDYL